MSAIWQRATRRRGLVFGATAMTLLSLPELSAHANSVPVSGQAIGPLVAAVIGSADDTLILSGIAPLTTLALTAAAHPANPVDLWTRPLVVAVISVIAVLLSWIRERQARHIAERDDILRLTSTLQSALLPDPVAASDAPASVFTAYRPGDAKMLLGGDFFDALTLEDGRLAFVIGDVVGHGPEAAAQGAELRAAWRALVLDSTASTPSDLLEGLNRLAGFGRATPTICATACCGIVEPVERVATLASAGHPAPLIVAEDVASSGVRPGLPLGVAGREPHDLTWPAHVLSLPEGWALFCYTDGLVEGRRALRAGRAGTDYLIRVIEDVIQCGRIGACDLGAVIDRMAQENGGSFEDDVAILVLCDHRGTGDRSRPATSAHEQPAATRGTPG